MPTLGPRRNVKSELIFGSLMAQLGLSQGAADCAEGKLLCRTIVAGKIALPFSFRLTAPEERPIFEDETTIRNRPGLDPVS
jgi:hypothetical protein